MCSSLALSGLRLRPTSHFFLFHALGPYRGQAPTGAWYVGSGSRLADFGRHMTTTEAFMAEFHTQID